MAYAVTDHSKNAGTVQAETRQVTVINVDLNVDSLPDSDEYLIQINGVQVARWTHYSRPAIRAGIGRQ
jgi:hypothetical protein